ncbi:MAG TPA: HD domain-containing protein [bacterium]|nr:HD domain-containing protein [bacterium]HPP09137.1 HD domain-containing protein [bacterium]
MVIKKAEKISLFQLINLVADTADMISPHLKGHQNNVSYIAVLIAKEMGLSVEKQNEILWAGLLHDIGATSLKERLESLNFEFENPHEHAKKGSFILKKFKYFESMARIIKFHHVKWEHGKGKEFEEEAVPFESHIIHLADKIDVLVNKNEEIFKQKDGIIKKINENKGEMFNPDIVDTLLSISDAEYFWIDISSPIMDGMISKRFNFKVIEIDINEFEEFSKILSDLIDFRSPFTFFHSIGVSMVAQEIAKYCGFSEYECKLMRVAGYLHDFGKIGIPVEIIDKKGKLEKDEFDIMKKHVYYTYRTFESIDSIDIINTWASLHHEKFDGTGYPFHLKGEMIPIGSRIMCVSDIFNALTEERPYRSKMDVKIGLKILQDMAKDKKIDPYLFSILEKNVDEINLKRLEVQNAARKEYIEF